MKRHTVARTADRRPSRLLVILAAAWMILSLAIGGAILPDSPADPQAPAPIVTRTQP